MPLFVWRPRLLPLKPSHARLLILLPSLRISGGVQETLRMAEGLQRRGIQVEVLVFWKHAHKSPHNSLSVHYLSNQPPSRGRVLLDMPLLWARFIRFVRTWSRLQQGPKSLLLTHYTTFPFAWLTPQSVRRYCFNQDLEWTFVGEGLRRSALRFLILHISRRARAVTTNSFITHQYELLGVSAFAQASIWAAPFWLNPQSSRQRLTDVVMLLRGGSIKRLDLYLELLSFLDGKPGLHFAAVTPDTEVAQQLKDSSVRIFLRPTNEEMKALYADSKIFLLLSDVEGFGLPPLEAMGCGCVPLCRDSGGVQCYMQGPLSENLIPLGESMQMVFHSIEHLLAQADQLSELSGLSVDAFQQGLTRSHAECENAYDCIAQAMRT